MSCAVRVGFSPRGARAIQYAVALATDDDKAVKPLGKQILEVFSCRSNRTGKQGIGSLAGLSAKTAGHIRMLYDTYRDGQVFSRADVMTLLDITASPASALIRRLLDLGMITTVKGRGKGRYRFGQPFI